MKESFRAYRASTVVGRQGFRRLLKYVHGHKGVLIFALTLVPVFVALQLWIPFLIREALQTLESTTEGREAGSGFWFRIFLLLLLLSLGFASIRFLSRFLMMRLSRQVEADLKQDFFDHLVHLPLSFHDKSRIGDLISRSNQDIELMRFMTGPALFFGVQILCQFPSILAILYVFSPLLGGAVTLFFAVLGLLMSSAFEGIQAKSRAVQEAQGEIGAKAQEDLSGIRVLQSFAREGAEVLAFGKVADQGLETQVDLARVRGKLEALFSLALEAGVLAVISVGVLAGLGIPDLFAVLYLLGMLVWPMLILGWIFQTYNRATAAVERIDEIFEYEPEGFGEEETPAASRSRPLKPSIEAKNLSFRYQEGAPPALDGVSFRLEANKTLGIVGPIGSGKTTLIALLSRLYEPPPGSLFLGERDVCDLSLLDLRKQISVAPQEPFLFGDSLRNNILFGADIHDMGEEDEMEEALVEEVVRASRLAPDLRSLPEGVEQIVGERGVTLSGGQKQRTSLARALAGGRQILVLDDTLSAVDHETEMHILERLRERKGRQTTIVVAHRLEAVREADLILVLDQGRIIERGTHERLLALGGWYARTWEQQQREEDT